MILSILIPTLPEPESQAYLSRLRGLLAPQICEGVEIIEDASPRNVPTGSKRNSLIDRAQGQYFCQIDTDDIVPNYYVKEILNAIKNEPDVITFNGFMTTDGGNRRNFIIKLGEHYEERDGKYIRYPNHLCVFKRDLVKHVRFEPIWIQEDYRWATKIRDLGLLKTEVHISKDMYHYDYKNKNKMVIPRRR